MIKHILKKEKDFVQISNSFFANNSISLKAKGIFALMFSLPENWNFNIEGITSKCKESKTSIASAIKELEAAGYIKRTKIRGADGKIIKMEYEVFEEPYTELQNENLCEENSCVEQQTEEYPKTENPIMDNPMEENQWVNNIKINKKENNNILFNNTKSNPISSKRKLSFSMSEMELFRYTIMENIDYDILIENDPIHKDMIDEIVELMTETICTKSKTITIASKTYTTELVKNKFLNIESEHIEYVIECMSKTTTKIGNIKQYLLAAIFNAPNTIVSYYKTQVNRDLL